MHRPLAFATLALLAACSPERDDSPAPPESTATWVLQCPSVGRIVVDEVQEKVWFFLPGETRELPHVIAASGVRYSDGEWTAWAKGQEIMIMKGEEVLDCANDRQAAVWEHAKLNGVDFRAVGQEPGWLLEIRNQDRLRLEADYGATVIDTALPPFAELPGGSSGRYKVETDSHKVMIELEAKPCIDIMSGDPYETSVTIELDGRTMYGCGRALH